MALLLCAHDARCWDHLEQPANSRPSASCVAPAPAAGANINSKHGQPRSRCRAPHPFSFLFFGPPPAGGTNINSERNRLGGRCDVLVATPGRLIDHLENSGLAQKLQRIRTLVRCAALRRVDLAVLIGSWAGVAAAAVLASSHLWSGILHSCGCKPGFLMCHNGAGAGRGRPAAGDGLPPRHRARAE